MGVDNGDIDRGQGRAEEDLACADLIDAHVSATAVPSDSAHRVRESAAATSFQEYLGANAPGIHRDDIDLACEIDRFDTALIADDIDGRLQLRQHTPSTMESASSDSPSQ